MSRAIEIAQNGLGTTAPNPMVGAVLVHEDRIVGEGYTSAFGGPHAEVNAVASVSDSGMLAESTLYVTLEPCSHFGKTPPCADLIIEKKIPTVVIGLKDSHLKVAGKGIEKLKAAGIEVILGVLEAECREHHRRFLTFHEKKRPYVVLKWAETADGFIAPPGSERGKNPGPVWISHAYSRQLVHQWRSEEQAILVGTNTVLKDNPKLDVRQWTGKNPIRIMLDRTLKTHLPATELSTDYHVLDGSVTTLILTEVGDRSRHRENVDYQIMDFSKDVVRNVMDILYQKNIQSVLIEGGEQTLQAFIDANIWDEARVFKGTTSFYKGIKAPKLSGKLIASKKIASDRLDIFRNPFNPLIKPWAMIKNIIFDFGDVFINLDKRIIFREMERFGGSAALSPKMVSLNESYEVGRISTEEFLEQLIEMYPDADSDEITGIWNGMLLDFPEKRLEFIEDLAQNGDYRLFLLSNTNALHIPHVEQLMGSDKFLRFKNCFEKFYLSHEINLRKPNTDIFKFVLNENGLKAEETLFIDDTLENIEAAGQLGIKCWHLQVGTEDVVQLKSRLL